MFEISVMQTFPNPSQLHRLISWAKAPVSLAQSAALLLLLSAGATAAWMPPQARHALVQRVEVAAHLPALPALFHASPPAQERDVVAALPPLLSQTVRTQSNALLAASLTVTSTGDGDVDPAAPPGTCITTSANGANCTLRAAIEVANANGGATINFTIPGAGEQVITPATTLPNISVPVTINGYSQGGKANSLGVGNDANLLVRLNGSQLLANQGGLIFDIGSAGSTLRGLSITDVRAGSGVRLRSDGNTVVGCSITGNGFDGITIQGGKNNTLGGPNVGDRNTLSGNTFDGVRITPDAQGNGGTGNTISNSYVGTNAAGSAAQPNNQGMEISTGGNTIGSASGLASNIIAANQGTGIALVQGDGNTIIGNLIGSDATNTNKLGNLGAGIQIGTTQNGGSASNNNIIGTVAGGNSIFGNGGPQGRSGVEVLNGTGNSIRGNRIDLNGALGIDLLSLGDTASNRVTPNDAGDADTGPNNLQNYPVIDLATNSPNSGGGISSLVQGTLNSLPNSQFSIDLYVSDSGDPSGLGEGATPARSGIMVNTDAEGNVQFDVTLSGADTTGRFVTATATRIVNNVAGDTSEFSRAVKGISDDPSSCPIEVTNTDDAGAGSLRRAIQCLNGNRSVTPRTVSFNIPGAGVHTIRPLSPLPFINTLAQSFAGVGSAIDGYTQPGSSANTLAQGDNATLLIEVDGSKAGNTNGFVLNSTIGDHATIRGLVINRFAQSGILSSGLNKNFVGCFIGTDVTGTLARPNGVGISLFSQGVVIGGKTPQERNLIAGNTREGIALSGGLAIGNTIQGNIIGTDATGTKALPNSVGIGLSVGAGANTIQTNLISGNTGAGIDINTGKTSFIHGNFIGTDATGGAIVSNGGDGIRITDSAKNSIDATKSDGGNVIAGNAGNGIFITGGASTGTIIQGNFIGTDAAGKAGLGNKGNGILFSGAAQGHTIGDALPATLSTQSVGPTSSGNGNTIANNGGAGVAIDLGTFTSCHRKSILGNSIYGNGKLGIDLKGGTEDKYGVTANQPVSNQGDGTSGPNALQNYPILSSAAIAGGNVTIAGTLVSAPSATFRIEFFSNAVADASRHGQGQTFIGFQNVTTDASGNAAISTTLPFSGTNLVFAATATDAVGNTSEFSVAVTAPAPTPPVATTTTVTSSLNLATPSQAVAFTATVTPASGTAKPTGTVTFSETDSAGTSTLGTVALSADGTATLPGSAHTLLGTHSITATYSGDANFNGSTSPVLNQIIASPTTTNNTLSINDVTVAKPATGTTNAVFTVTLATGTSATGKKKTAIVKPGTKSSKGVAAGGNVTVNYATANGTAIVDTDYGVTSGTLTFSPGQTTQTISVPIVGGAGTGVPKTFTVNLSGETNATVSRRTATGTITSVAPSSPNVVVTQTASATSVASGAQVTFNLSVQNTGTASAPDVVVFNTLPTGATFVSANPSATQNGQTLSFSLGALAAGASQTLSVVVTAPNATTTLINTSTASATGPGGTQSAPSTASVAVTDSQGGVPTDASGLITVSRGRLTTFGPYTPGLYRKGNRARQIVTIRNKSKTPIVGPMYLVLDGLNVTLLNPSGTTVGGSPFILLPLQNNVVNAGKSISVPVFFGVFGRTKPSYSTRVLSGTGSP